MKIYLIAICVFLAINPVHGREGDVTPTMQMFRQLELCIYDDFIDRGENLPGSFESIASLRRILEAHPKMIQNLNKFTIVPGAPFIQPVQGLAHEFSGNRLFATSRTSDLQPSRIGRLVLFATSNGSSVFPYWIPEPQFQIILKQLKGFDPAKQPLAFQDLAQGDAGKAPRQRSPNHNEDLVKGEPHPLLPDQANIKRTFKKPSESHSFWIIGGIIFLISVIGYVIRQRRCKPPQ